jgi:hypothetical protein
MAGKRAGAVGAFAAAVAAAVALLSAPSGALSPAQRLFGDRHVAVEAAAHAAHLSVVRVSWPRRSTEPTFVDLAAAAGFVLAPIGVAVSVGRDSFGAARRARPAVRGPPPLRIA